VGDIQSSDPYCVVFVGSKRVGKTAVRSWTVNPTWNQHFTVPLLHLKHPVTFEIWDHDSVGADDILGKVTLNLSDLPPNIKMAKKMNLEKASPTIKPRGTLQFDILLEVIYFCTNLSAL
jgi:Ca2+-dependent lipid-binding protein